MTTTIVGGNYLLRCTLTVVVVLANAFRLQTQYRYSNVIRVLRHSYFWRFFVFSRKANENRFIRNLARPELF